MLSSQVRQKYFDFFTDKIRQHKKIAPAKLVLEDDPTTLFTSSGMQPLIPYLLGEKHAQGSRLVNSQPSFRAEDMDEVGDNRHTTFFEMLGNWSLGDYFKEEQISWFFEFLTKELGLEKNRLYISVFEGDQDIPKDEESYEIWKKLGVGESNIHFYGVSKNWWSRSGSPQDMPAGEIGGPDTEVFYEFPQIEHNSQYGDSCHPNCDCGRFLEIGNSVFIHYRKRKDGGFEKLTQHNVDFGGGLERLTAAVNEEPDIFKTDLFWPLIEELEKQTRTTYEDKAENFRIIADHIKAAVFLIRDGVLPGNKLQGYVLRRLLRRCMVKLSSTPGVNMSLLSLLPENVIKIYQKTDYFSGVKSEEFSKVIDEEVAKFRESLNKGLREIEKIEKIDGKLAFNLYQSYGFPLEITEELFAQKGQKIDHQQFEEEFKKHQELSRTASSGMFKGGLAGHSQQEIKYHTATHLLQQALRDVLGPQVLQKGSNINPERLRFDFSFDRKLTDEEIKKVEDLVNQKIEEDLEVDKKTMSLEEAKILNAIGVFEEKYGDMVSIYGIGPDCELDKTAKDTRERGGYYSLELCGGPHVETTGIIGKVKIDKEEAVSSGIRRIRMSLV